MKYNIFVIEGTDGSGKQTQSKKLYERLLGNNFDAIMQSFPNYESPSSGPVKMYLGGELGATANDMNAYQASAFFAVDRLCTIKQLQKTLNDNSVIIFDRYVSSNMLHQSCKISNLTERDKFLSWLDTLEFETFLLPRPTQTIFLDMPVAMSKQLANERTNLKTGGKKDIHESDENHLHAAYDAGHYVANKFGWNVVKCVNNSGEIRSIEDIHEEVWNICKNALQ